MNDALKMEEIFWRQKANIKWFMEGGRNTKLYHAIAKSKSARSRLSRIQNSDGHWLADEKRHLCSWDSVTLPYEEGGLGIRKFEDVQNSFRIKQVWNLLLNTSLWSNHFSTKYLKEHHLLRSTRNNHPKTLRILIPWFAIVVANTKFLIGNGNFADFWCDNWLGTSSLLSQKLAEVLINGQWQLEMLSPVLDDHLLEEVLAAGISLTTQEIMAFLGWSIL